MSNTTMLPSKFLSQFKQVDRNNPRALAKHYMQIWQDIIEEQKDWAEMCEKSQKVYNREMRVTINMHRSIVDFMTNYMWPGSPKPTVEHLQSNNAINNRLYRKVATTYRNTLQREMDNSSFDRALKDAIRNGMLFGRGTVQIGVRKPTERYPLPCLTFKSYPWNRFFVQGADDWADTKIVMTIEKYRLSDLGMNSVQNTPSDGQQVFEPSAHTEHYIEKNEDGGKEKFMHVLKVWDKNDYSITEIWMERGTVINRYQDYMKLPDFFPFMEPIQPVTQHDCYMPRCPFELYKDAQQRLNDIQESIDSMLPGIKAKGVLMDNNDAINEMVRSTQNSWHIIKDQTVIANIRQGAKISDFIHEFNPTQISACLAELGKEAFSIVSYINDITGVNDLMRGQTDAREAAQTQQLKAQFGNVRTRSREQNVQWSVRNALQIMFDIIKRYPIQLLNEKSQSMLDPRKPEDQQVIRLLQNSSSTKYRIDIDSESLRNADISQNIEKLNVFDAMDNQLLEKFSVIFESSPYLALSYIKRQNAKLDWFGFERGQRAYIQEGLDLLAERCENEIQRISTPEGQLSKEEEEYQKKALLDPQMRETLAKEAKIRAEIDEIYSNVALNATKTQNEAQKIQLDAEKMELTAWIEGDKILLAEVKQEEDSERDMFKALIENKKVDAGIVDDQQDNKLDMLEYLLEKLNSNREYEIEKIRAREEVKQNKTNDSRRNIATDVSINTT